LANLPTCQKNGLPHPMLVPWNTENGSATATF